MGADYIGWRGCPLQQALGPEGFLGKLKLRSYRSAIETQVPPARRDAVRVRIEVTGRAPRDLAYDDILSELGGFEAGIPDCSGCPLSEGRALGCYRYVTYPIDASFERLLFEFYTSRVTDEESVAWQLHEDLVSRLPRDPGAWHRMRGPTPGMLAELVEPLAFEWIDARGAHRVDSARLCEALFITLDDPVMIVAYARFWNELFEWLDARLARRLAGETPGADALASRTLREIQHVSDLLNASVARASTDGWHVLVDA